MQTVDYLIVGAGSAGCVLANRLSACGNYRVALLEYGGWDGGPLIQMPAALSYPMNMPWYDWGYSSVAQKHLGDRVLATPRGKVLGGSSSINGMVYVRGHPEDFNNWQKLGAKNWDYAHVAPYYQRMENALDSPERGSWRGNSGPMYVSRGDAKNPLFQAFLQAGEQAGFVRTADYNGSQQEGFGVMESTIYRGRRWSAANAYLSASVRRRKNLLLIGGCATKILFSGKQAVGIEYVNRAKRLDKLMVNKEVILSASSINSPKLLMLSGIGDEQHLREHAIEVKANLPGVGGNLQDHLELYIQQACKLPISLYKHMNMFSKAMIGLRWLLFKTGVGASNQFEAAAFVRSAAQVKYPDIQYHFLPLAIRYDGKLTFTGHGYQTHVGPMRSKSRGTVRLAHKDHAASALIDFNYMSHADDWRDFRHCIRLTRQIMQQSAFADYNAGEISPGADCQSDEQLDEFIRSNVESAYHPCGTCKMGDSSDKQAVVDSECKVIGVAGLRVIDSSVFPSITNGNINAPTLMVAEKAADMVLAKEPLPAFTDEPWINPNWQTSDR